MRNASEYLLDKIRQKVQKDVQTHGKLGATLRYKRKEFNYTLAELSQRFSISISYISKIENDLIKPNITYIIPLLESLEIKEDVLIMSEYMDDFYKLTINHMINKSNTKAFIKEHADQRNDFQSKLIEFAFMVKDNKLQEANKMVGLLFLSLDNMTQIEFALFVFSLVELYLLNGDVLLAGKTFIEMKPYYMVYDGIELWFYKLAFELSQYHSSYKHYKFIYETYNKLLIEHNMINTIKENRKIFINHLVFFNPKLLIKEFQVDTFPQYRLSLVVAKEYDIFLQLDYENDVAQALYEDLVLSKEPQYKTISYNESLFVQSLKVYFHMKYEDRKALFFLREAVFSSNQYAAHHCISYFYGNILIELLSNQNKYKECYQIQKRLSQIDKQRNAYFDGIK